MKNKRKYNLRDSVLNDARNKALEMSHLPDSIKKAFHTEIKDGQVILTPKKAKNKNAK
jgi:hypothetical protein